MGVHSLWLKDQMKNIAGDARDVRTHDASAASSLVQHSPAAATYAYGVPGRRTGGEGGGGEGVN